MPPITKRALSVPQPDYSIVSMMSPVAKTASVPQSQPASQPTVTLLPPVY